MSYMGLFYRFKMCLEYVKLAKNSSEYFLVVMFFSHIFLLLFIFILNIHKYKYISEVIWLFLGKYLKVYNFYFKVFSSPVFCFYYGLEK